MTFELVSKWQCLGTWKEVTNSCELNELDRARDLDAGTPSRPEKGAEIA